MSAGSPSGDAQTGAPQPGIRRFIAPSLALHAALPFVLWGLATVDTDVAGTVFLSIHFGFPVVLLATFRWWRPHWQAWVWLGVANHVVTLTVGALLITAFG